MKHFSFGIFRAFDHPQKWSQYIEGHAQVLLDFGITNLTSHRASWCENPNVHVITCTDENKELVGAIRIQGYHPNFNLPVQEAIGDIDPALNEHIHQNRSIGVGEICGLWTAKGFNRLGIAHYLSRAAIATTSELGLGIIYGISSPFTLKMFLQLGYIIMENLGVNGNYFYPTADFLSTAVIIPNTATLEFATPVHLGRINSLRASKSQVALESHQNVEVEIEYNLLIQQS